MKKRNGPLAGNKAIVASYSAATACKGRPPGMMGNYTSCQGIYRDNLIPLLHAIFRITSVVTLKLHYLWPNSGYISYIQLFLAAEHHQWDGISSCDINERGHSQWFVVKQHRSYGYSIYHIIAPVSPVCSGLCTQTGIDVHYRYECSNICFTCWQVGCMLVYWQYQQIQCLYLFCTHLH